MKLKVLILFSISMMNLNSLISQTKIAVIDFDSIVEIELQNNSQNLLNNCRDSILKLGELWVEKFRSEMIKFERLLLSSENNDSMRKYEQRLIEEQHEIEKFEKYANETLPQKYDQLVKSTEMVVRDHLIEIGKIRNYDLIIEEKGILQMSNNVTFEVIEKIELLAKEKSIIEIEVSNFKNEFNKFLNIYKTRIKMYGT